MCSSVLRHLFVFWLSGLLCACVVGIPTMAALTGNLQVEVTDANGIPLPGASVEIESPSQLGVRSAPTNASGTARFNVAEPGIYKIRVSLQGYGTVIQQDNQVRVDRTTYVTIRLQERLVETVTVTAQTPLVDVTSTTIGQDLPRDFVDSIPTTRSVYSEFPLVAGVGVSTNPYVHGATDTDNLYLVDGTNITDPFLGTAGTAVNYEVIDHHSITTGGHMAEYGGVVGLTSNVVTKSGGNEWSGSVSFYRQDRDWNSDFDVDAIASSQVTSWNTSYTLGGPILKDRLWHFTSFQKIRSETETLVPGDSVERPDRVFDADRVFAKLTWQVNQRHRVRARLNRTDGVIFNVNASRVTIDPDQFSRQNQPTKDTALSYTGVLGPNLVLEGHLNFFRLDIDAVPQFPELGPNHGAIGTTRQYGRYAFEDLTVRDRDEVRMDLNWFHPKGMGEHNLRFGVHYQETDSRRLTIDSGGMRFFDRQAPGRSLWNIFGPGGGLLVRFDGLDRYNDGWECYLGGVRCADQTVAPSAFTNPADWQMVIDGAAYGPTDFVFNDPSENVEAANAGWTRFVRLTSSELGNAGFVGQSIYALYVQDDWRVGKLTIRIGLRAEKQRFRNSRGQDLFTFDTTFGPRLGLSCDLDGDGRRKLYAHYGRLYDPLRDNTASFAGQLGQPLSETQYWFATLGDYFTWMASGGPGTPNGTISPRLRTPHTDEYLIGYAAALGKSMSLEVTGLHRTTKDLTSDFDPVLGLGDPAVYPTLQVGPTLESLGFSDRNGDGSVDTADIDTRFVVYNPPGGLREFDGVDLVFRKRFSRSWRLLASYSYADADGNVIRDGTFDLVGDDAYFDPRLPYNFGNLIIRDHTFKAAGWYRFPFDLHIGGVFRWLSGTHYGLGVVTPDQNAADRWDGDPARIVDTLNINRAQFSTTLGIPLTLPDGSNNPALDQAIIALVPFDLRAGTGAYENPSRYRFDLRFRYLFPVYEKLAGELFFDIVNVLNEQGTVSRDGTLDTISGVSVDPSNISDRAIYTFGLPLSTQSPRSYFAGIRFSF